MADPEPRGSTPGILKGRDSASQSRRSRVKCSPTHATAQINQRPSRHGTAEPRRTSAHLPVVSACFDYIKACSVANLWHFVGVP